MEWPGASALERDRPEGMELSLADVGYLLSLGLLSLGFCLCEKGIKIALLPL